MNADLTVTDASSPPQIQNPNSKIENVIRVSSGHKRNGKVARLPKAVRDKINQWLDDGRTYPQIIKDLGDDANDLKPGHFSEWRKGGYEDYLRHQEWRDQLRILRENGSEMTELTDGPKFQETLIQIALTEIFRVLQERELKPDSLNYIRLFNALARLNREALGLRKYNDQLAKEEAALKHLDPNRKLTENEHLALVDAFDRVLEMPRPPGTKYVPDPCRRRREETQTNDQPADSDPPNAEHETRAIQKSTSDARSSLGKSGPDREEAQTHDQPAISNSRTDLSSSIENPKSKIKNALSPLPSRPCQADTRDLADSDRNPTLNPSRGEVASSHASRITHHDSSIENQSGRTSLVSKIENCLDCGSPLPPVPPHSLRRPDDHCPSCGTRLPDIGLCYQPGSDHCLNCGATQPALLPGGERPRPYCHKCGTRLHNPELPAH